MWTISCNGDLAEENTFPRPVFKKESSYWTISCDCDLAEEKIFSRPVSFKNESSYWQMFEVENNPAIKLKLSSGFTGKKSCPLIPKNNGSSAVSNNNNSSSAVDRMNNSSQVFREKNLSSRSSKRNNSSVLHKQNDMSPRLTKDRSSTVFQPRTVSSSGFKPNNTASPVFKPKAASSPVFKPKATPSSVHTPRTSSSSRVSETTSRLLPAASETQIAEPSSRPFRLCSDSDIFSWAFVFVIIAAVCNSISNVLLVIGTTEIWEDAPMMPQTTNDSGSDSAAGEAAVRDFATMIPYLVVLMTVTHILACLLRLAHLTADVTCFKELALFVSVACVMVMSQQSALEMLFVHFDPNGWQLASLLFLALSTGSHFIVIMLVGKYTFTGTTDMFESPRSSHRHRITAV